MQLMKKTEENAAFRILSALGIIFIVAGHADFQIFDLGGLFPYYSFHVELFLFISGYFYKEGEEDRIPAYLRRKAVSLLLPYFIWNLVYGLLATALRGAGFVIGETISFRTLFIDPFLGGHQFGYNFPAWFVPALFTVEVINVCMRRALKLLKLNREWLITAGCLAAGIFTVWMAIGGHVWGVYKFPGRILFMLPVFEFGQLYRRKLEALDRLPNGIYFAVLILLQLIMELNCAGLAFSTVWCTGFANGPVIPYVSVLTGIAFWLRVAKILEPLYREKGFFGRLGRGTYAIMMHHIAGFMLVKGVFYLLSLWTPLCRDFDRAAFFSDINYTYLMNGMDAMKWVYLGVGIGLPLVIARLRPRLWNRT